MYSYNMPHIDGHWSSGGTGITNFSPERLPIYETALKEHGDKDLWISKKPMGSGQSTNMFSLHCNTRKDLSAFWKCFEEQEKGKM